MLTKNHLFALTSLGLIFGSTLQAEDQAHPASKYAFEEKTKTDANVADAGAPDANVEVKKPEQKIDVEKLSEAFGNVLGTNLKASGIQFSLDGVVKGIRAGYEGKSSPLTDKEFEEMMVLVQEKAMKEKAEVNLKAANEFMQKNSKAEGVKEIVPGKLDYQVLKEGTGAVVEQHSSPQIHYSGKYQNGTVFGSSEEMGGPITIPLDQTIAGFSKGIIGMKEGEKRRLFVHPDLGYGTSGQLPPNELLIFDVEVVKANSDDKQESAMNGDQNGQVMVEEVDIEEEDEDDNDDDDDNDDEDDNNDKASKVRVNPSNSVSH